MSYACTWCASSLDSRADLERHFTANPDCSKNRTVSNGTQSKYRERIFDESGQIELLPDQPGQPTLDKVRARLEGTVKRSHTEVVQGREVRVIDEVELRSVHLSGMDLASGPDETVIVEKLADGQIIQHKPGLFEIVHDDD